MYQWLYATPLSGLSFPMVTASGTYAKSYAATALSAVISKDGGAWAALGSRISGIPGDGVYTLAALSSTEMTCYSWLIKITANSGSLDQSILGYNLSSVNLLSAISGLKNDVSGLPGILAASSGPVVLRPGTHTNALVGLWGSTHTSAQIAVVDTILNPTSSAVSVDVSSIAYQVWNSKTGTYSASGTLAGSVVETVSNTSNIAGIVSSGVYPTIVAISGIKNDVSGLPGILVAASGTTTAVASGFAPILAAVSGATAITNTSAVALQVWNTARTVAASSTTFGGMVEVSGLANLLGAVSGLGVNPLNVSGLSPIMTQVSALASITVAVSGLNGILSAISGLANDVSGINGLQTSVSNIPGNIANYVIDDAAALTSGTVGHTLRQLRWFAWEDLKIDKTYLPNRLYLKSDETNYSSWWSLIDNVNNTERIRGG